MKDEIWRDVLGYEGHYLISNMGRVKSIKLKKNKILNPGRNSGGYLHVSLYKNKTQTSQLVHRLVAEVFLANTQGKRTVNHINGIKTDNMVSNLEWATYSENQKHAFANGLKCNKGLLNGQKNGQSKLTKDQVIEIRALCDLGVKRKDIILKMGLDVDPTRISAIKTRKSWPHI